MKNILFILTFYLLYLHAVAQSPLSWTWMNGDESYSMTSLYGIRGVESPGNKPPSRNLSVSWTDKQGNFWMFGGGHDHYGNVPMYNDLWRYNPANNQWTWMHGDTVENNPGVYGTIGVASAQNKPGARFGAASWTDKDGNFWLFGGTFGYGGSNYGTLNDLWKYDPLTNMWTWVKGSNLPDANSIYGVKGIRDINNMPGATEIANYWTDKEGNFWLFGGYAFNATGTFGIYSTILWRYEPSINTWTWMKGAQTNISPVYGTQGTAADANIPGATLSGTTWVDSTGNLWLFGGEINLIMLNDLWKYDPLTNMWTWMRGDKAIVPAGLYGIPTKYGIKDSANINNSPGGRVRGAAWLDGDDNLWQFGGLGYISGQVVGELNDLWRYNIPTNTWTWIKGDTVVDGHGHYGIKGVADTLNEPPSRSQVVSWKDKSGNNWLFGDYYYNDLWKIGSTGFSLPTLLTLHAEAAQDNILVGWETTREVNTDHFILERGADRNTFSPLYTTLAAGNSTNLRTYSYPDIQPLVDTNFYRLKIVNTNGSFTYSNIVAVKINKPQIFLGPAILYPNPATDIITIHLNGNNENMSLQIFDAIGRKIMKEEFIINGDIKHEVNIKKLSSAVYILKLKSARRSLQEKFIKL